MKHIFFLLLISIIFISCSQEDKNSFEKPQKLSSIVPNTYLLKTTFDELPDFNQENYSEVLKEFANNCRTSKAKKIYAELCLHLNDISDPKTFLTSNFTPYMITTQERKREGLLTGYYEAQLYASLTKSKIYKYPIYETPNDLITVDLSSIYPALKHYRLRGRLEGNKIVPYDTRAESKQAKVDAKVICYCNSKIDKFFLEIQGSGKVALDNNRTIYIGYDNQNGHKYRAIGRYLVKIGALELKDVSLQSIKTWLKNNPSRVDEVLNYNKSLVYFKQRTQGATGALGLELTPKRSIAVDRKYIPLGSMLYLNANVDDENLSRVVFAQDTGGAIKGAIRADLFLGSGEKALEISGHLKSTLKLWILLPKKEEKKR
jgi:membrane-bound lytic murein transglycosylase A